RRPIDARGAERPVRDLDFDTGGQRPHEDGRRVDGCRRLATDRLAAPEGELGVVGREARFPLLYAAAGAGSQRRDVLRLNVVEAQTPGRRDAVDDVAGGLEERELRPIV